MSKYLCRPVIPIEIDEHSNVAQLISKMGDTAFQGKNLSLAVTVWQKMLASNATIFFGLAGAMVPAGMRKLIVYLIENHLIDCLVSTGANLFHDIHETLGYYHYQGNHQVDDTVLRREKVDRIYDVFGSDTEFIKTDEFLADFSNTLEENHLYSTREFLYLLGKNLGQQCTETGILTAASGAGTPIYCPAIADSSIAIALSAFKAKHILFDIIQDVKETAEIVLQAGATGVIYIGGGTPKNFIQQAEVTANLINKEIAGHEYALQITTDSPQWGGLSGCTFEEAQSWGKITDTAGTATIYADATIVLPLLVTALVQSSQDLMKRRKRTDLFLTLRENVR